MQCKIVSFAYRAYAYVYFAYHKNKKNSHPPAPPHGSRFFQCRCKYSFDSLQRLFLVCSTL